MPNCALRNYEFTRVVVDISLADNRRPPVNAEV